ncbi:A disintegrin and metalloproteinase with thrombospondin motifs 19-like [Salvelinus fontinalis]|uniref:A disintegrin and metalloproteinase with thrombospondin motifs 19-like n=1 Tax=Salvelinus fontinalis TaxID=8038 RepID=UPI002485B180|nr:A disintegrin and metalloproteinase with thrombospondin motifs 19-like [Salvelinus fontinalis]
MHLKRIFSLLHQLCFLGAFAIADPHPFQESESEIIFPEVFPDTGPPPSDKPNSRETDASAGAPDKPTSRETDASAGSSSREVRSISNWEEYESPELYHWEPQGPQTAASTGLRLRIPAFGRDLHLILKRDTRFLSQKFMVERRQKAQKASRSGMPVSSAANTEERGCYYSGTVLNYAGSIASFSTCAGLMGFIQLNGDFLYIEPVNRTLAVAGQAHRVTRRKRSTTEERQTDKQTTDKQTSGNYCGVIPERQKSKTRKPSEGGRGKRYSYKLLHEYNVETVVVADPAMVSYHGSEAAKRFILTIMNMVFNLFQHKSLGIQINIRLTKLVLLHETPSDMYIGHHGEKMLESFCRWQQEEYGKKSVMSDFSTRWREDLPSVDTAILITRKDFCVHKDEPCDTVGIAYLSGMCSERRKCILAEDNGLNLAFTIAHEMGHNMGVSHDNDHQSCADGLHIMSGEWVKGQNLGDVSWSGCSRDDVEKFLRSKASSCLLQTDPLSLNSVILPFKHPGMTYTADEQCQILFGATASHCQNMQYVMCSGLWCRVDGEKDCKTKLDPPMDGTECDPGKWCRAGECVSRAVPVEQAMGEWSTWGSWGTCSPTCSTGISGRQRKCESPSGKSRDCVGSRMQYRLCENLPCPAGSPSFRDQQCQTFNRPSLHWHSVMDDERPCTLFCSSTGKEQPRLLAEKVLDGTSCGSQESGLCANGTCQKVGCDRILSSMAREDHCGMCNGNGKSCKVIKGDFNHTKGAGYVEAVIIPKGARRIRVVEEKPAQSYLALKDTNKHSINSDWKIDRPGAFNMAGTTVHYVRRGLWEKMSARGPTTSPLHLMVLLFNEQNHGIHYEYTIPTEANMEPQGGLGPGAMPSESLFMWTHSGWEDCHAVCGGGERKTIVTCTNIVNKTTSVVDHRRCRHLTKPEPQIRKCNDQPCQTRWMMTEWTSCSRTCGRGSQSRQVACTLQLANGTLVKAKDRDCAGPKPAPTQRCEGQDCLTVWEAGVWSECSVKCGRGARHRLVKCTNPRKKCDLSTLPRETEDCEDYSKCYIWRTGDWAKCSVTCGKSMQSRVIQCMHKITGRHGNECFSSEKPAAYRPCQQQACNERINVNTITSPRLAALTFKCLRDQWPVYCKVIREKNLCQDMRWYQRCCETCRDFYAQKMQQRS